MKYLIAGLICLSLSSALYAQTTLKKPVKQAPVAVISISPIPDSVTVSATALAKYLVTHNTSQLEVLRSLYAWMSSHITYDVVNTYKPDYYKDTADAVDKTLRTRTAVCQGYASLFMETARKAGIPAWLVSGYPMKDGKPDVASHAWVAVFTDSKWLLIDPTWGAGYVNNNKYQAKLNWSYFLVPPAAFIKTHVPFDPLFQFLEHPLRHDEIRDGKWTAARDNPPFAYKDTLAAFAGMSALKQAGNSLARIERYGITNQMITVELSYLQNVIANGKLQEDVNAQNSQVNKMNGISSRLNEVTNAFNEYIVFKNQQFSPSKPDNEIREWIDGMAAQLGDIGKLLDEVKPDPAYNGNMAEMRTAAGGLKQRVTEEQAFVTKYLKTGRLFRKSLFYKMRF